MPPKTRAEIQKAHRQRKMEREGITKKKGKKPRAEIQREYRERKMQADSEAFLKKERERKRATYTPTCLLSESLQAKRHKENREKARRFRNKLKATSIIEDEDNDQNGVEEADEEAGCSSNIQQKGRLLIKMDFKAASKRVRTRKRISRGISKANRKIKSLETPIPS